MRKQLCMGGDKVGHKNYLPVDSDRYLANLSGPMMIAWDITNRCNLNCFHCLNCSGDAVAHDFSAELSIEEAMDLTNQIIAFHPLSVCVCGGEPTLRHDLTQIVREMAKSGIQVNMVSNGLELPDSKIVELKDAGLSFLQISIDGARAETHNAFRNNDRSFESATKAVKDAVRRQLHVATSFCPTRENIPQFRDYVGLVRELGCRNIRMMPFLPMGRGLGYSRSLLPSEEQYLDLKLEIATQRVIHTDMQIEWGDPLEHIYIAVHKPRPEPIVMEIRANGDIAPSIYLPISVGNAMRHPLRDYWEAGFNRIWANPDVLELAKAVQTIDDFFHASLHTWTVDRKRIDLVDLGKSKS